MKLSPHHESTVIFNDQSASYEESRLIAPEIVANELGISAGTLAVWRSVGRYDLAFVKVGKLVRYRVGDVVSFLQRHTKGEF